MDFDFGVPSRAHELFQRLESQGADYVQTLVSAQKSEELFLDYKKIATKDDARSLHDSDRSNLRKALSGFANSEGGVILWGLETAKSDGVEVLKLPEGHPDVARFTSLIEDAVSGCTIPPVPGVRSIKIPLNDDGARGIVATLVPASLIAPHQTADDARAYYMRAGSSFQRVPHGVLAGMFGRRPAPLVSLRYGLQGCYVDADYDGPRLNLDITLEIFNASSVIARGAYISWQAKNIGSKTSKIDAYSLYESWWILNKVDARNGSIIASENYRLAPFSRNPALNLCLFLNLPEDSSEDIEVDFFFGCESAPPQHKRLRISSDQIKNATDDLESQFGSSWRWNHKNLEIGLRLIGVLLEG